MGCARAFGALIDMRDEPQNAEIPESFHESSYHKEQIEKNETELNALLAITPEIAEEKARSAYEASVDYHTDAIAKRDALKAKYKAMLSDVKSYSSPSPDHDNFKKFMADQIRQSIEFDCGGDYHERAIAGAKALAGHEWVEAEKQRLEESIEYHRKHQAEDDERNRQRNEWVRKLRESLN